MIPLAAVASTCMRTRGSTIARSLSSVATPDPLHAPLCTASSCDADLLFARIARVFHKVVPLGHRMSGCRLALQSAAAPISVCVHIHDMASRLRFMALDKPRPVLQVPADFLLSTPLHCSFTRYTGSGRSAAKYLHIAAVTRKAGRRTHPRSH